MAWRDRREERVEPWEDRRQRRPRGIPVWEHEESRDDRDRYERDERERERYDRYDRRDYDRRRERSRERYPRDRDDSRDRDRDRGNSRDRDRDRDRYEREDRREYTRDRSRHRSHDSDDVPSPPSPPTFTTDVEYEEQSQADTREPGEASMPSLGDWYCVCGALNFRRRATCYRHGCQYGRSDGKVYTPEVKTSTDESMAFGITKKLLFRRLDTLTNEERILEVLNERVPEIVNTITGITISKDYLTGTSRGMAYLGFNSIADSSAAHSALLKLNPHLRIDNRDVLISYCTNQRKAWAPQVPAYAPAGPDYTAHLSEADRINAAAAVAQSAINAAQARTMWMPHAATPFVSSASQVVSAKDPPDGKGLTKYSAPDVRTFMYDETSGYYYDPATGLYYDGSTQYFFNNKINSYLYWDANNSTYYLATQTTQNTEQPKLPSPPEVTVQNTITKEETCVEEKKKDKEDKVKVAKKIAKDMARWAKTLNQKKENARNGLVMEQVLDTSASKGSADIGFSVLGASGPAFPPIQRELSPPPPLDLVPAEEHPIDNDDGIIDWSKLTCLLCKRRFPSVDVLTKHKTMSDLHKQNLAEHHKNMTLEQMKGYRDRAAERRMKYGEFEEPVKKIYQPPPPVIVPQAQSSVVDTIGGKMLQKMGWSEGRGLGKEEQGRTAPIEAERRVNLVGLGQKRGIYTAAPGETYKYTVKKLMIARYKDLVGDDD